MSFSTAILFESVRLSNITNEVEHIIGKQIPIFQITISHQIGLCRLKDTINMTNRRKQTTWFTFPELSVSNWESGFEQPECT